MFILTVAGKENEGAYSVKDAEGNQILYLFEEEDDATRFAMMLEDDQDIQKCTLLRLKMKL